MWLVAMKAKLTLRPRLRQRQQCEPDLDANNFKVDHPEQFPLATAVEYKAAPALKVPRCLLQPDIARAVPVISVPVFRASPEIKARAG